MPDSIVDTEWLADHLIDDDLVSIDVRALQPYLQALVPGAVNLPEFFLKGHDECPPPAAAMSTAFGSLGVTRDAPIVAYDGGASPAAARMSWILRYCRHERAAILTGGMTKWLREGRDTRADPVRFANALIDHVCRAGITWIRQIGQLHCGLEGAGQPDRHPD